MARLRRKYYIIFVLCIVQIVNDFILYSAADKIGLENVSKFPAIFDRLILHGWSREELGDLAGGNLLRVFGVVEKTRDLMSKDPPADTVIDKADLLKFKDVGACRSDDIKPPTETGT